MLACMTVCVLARSLACSLGHGLVCECVCRLFGASCVLGHARYREVYECPCKSSKRLVVSLLAASVC